MTWSIFFFSCQLFLNYFCVILNTNLNSECRYRHRTVRRRHRYTIDIHNDPKEKINQNEREIIHKKWRLIANQVQEDRWSTLKDGCKFIMVLIADFSKGRNNFVNFTCGAFYTEYYFDLVFHVNVYFKFTVIWCM